MTHFSKSDSHSSRIERCRAATGTAASVIAMLVAMPIAGAGAALAADAAPATQTAQAPAVEEIVVTGSRIVRDGYEAPTPVSVLGVEDIQAAATTNIADSINRLPVFAGSTTPHNSSSNVSTGTSGINNLNLRGLGPIRTLVLVDGARVVGSTLQGFNNNGMAVDINTIPSSLVTRVDVVTGGASAAYGSDALAGVVNFVLDHQFVGVKGEVEGGVTTYGDDRQWKVNLTGGTSFGNGRGHFLINAEANNTAGISGNPRSWAKNTYQFYNNPAYGTGAGQSTSVPQLLIRNNSGLATATPGGLITGSVLKGIAFGPGGTPYQFNYGSLVSGNLASGGDWASNKIDDKLDLDIQLAAKTAFSRFSYEVTDNIEVFAQLQWGFSRADINTVPNFYLGSLTVAQDNAFLPDSVRAAMVANKLATVPFGTVNGDVPNLAAHTERTFRRWVLGSNGKFDAMDTNWNWDAYYQWSMTHVSARAPSNIITANLRLAMDAVRAASGAIVCRSTLTSPANGCVPYNAMGRGVNSQAAINYVSGTGFAITNLIQNAAGATVRGEPFSSWAGPVSLATGIEWRKEEVKGTASALDEANAFFAGNYHASKGRYEVAEGFVETVVPLAKDTVWAKSLDLNAAIRATSYSTSGYVTTWKVGATYQPIDDMRFRATKSRDIRAPNLGDLFNAGRSGTGAVNDTFNNNTPVVIVSQITGNPLLVPEEADTTGLGVVLQPTFFRGFQASLDYYKIDISGAISSLSTQQYVDRCFQGVTALCPFIVRNSAGTITTIQVKPANILSQNTDGLDMEASYKLLLADINSNWAGDITFRALATHVLHLRSIDLQSVIEGAGAQLDGASGGLTAPKFRYTASVAYHGEALTTTLTMRGIGAGVFDNTFIQCTSGCPVATIANPTIDTNYFPAIKYFDLAFNYKFIQDGGTAEAFFTVENMMNQDPPAVPGSRGNGYYSGPGTGNFYDRLGRFFHAGVRFKM